MESTESVNTDPATSPVKAPKSLVKGEIGDLKKEVPKKPRERDRTKDRSSTIKPIQPPKQQRESIASVLSPVESDFPPPETPAPLQLDLLSPVTSEPSAVRPESRDTPPPPDLNPGASNSDVFNTAGRISRRARGSVSYAEPNLRDKMRRPTKDLVDAVGADERGQRAASAKPDGSKSESEDANGTEMNQVIRTVIIKKEDALSESSKWKSLASIETSKSQQERAKAEASSPLGNKTTADLPASVITERKRRTSALHRSEEPSQYDDKPATSGSGTAIAALVAAGGSKKLKNVLLEPREEQEEKKQLDDPLGIYDFDESTPSGHETIIVGKEQPLVTGLMRSSRRQSSVLSSSRILAAALDAGSEGKEGAAASKSGRRRRETLGGAESTGLNVPLAEGQGEAKAENPNLKAAKSVLGLGAGFAEGGSGRAERAASRRRSMML